MNRLAHQGFSLVPALFLIIVLSVLGAIAVRMSVVQSQTVVLNMQATRAYEAARSALEQASYAAVINDSCGASSISFTEGGLAGFTANLSCSSTSHDEGQVTITVYTIEAFAWSGAYGQPDYVSRRLRSTVTDAS